jgi:hypothetical protein
MNYVWAIDDYDGASTFYRDDADSANVLLWVPEQIKVAEHGDESAREIAIAALTYQSFKSRSSSCP